MLPKHSAHARAPFCHPTEMNISKISWREDLKEVLRERSRVQSRKSRLTEIHLGVTGYPKIRVSNVCIISWRRFFAILEQEFCRAKRTTDQSVISPLSDCCKPVEPDEHLMRG